MDLPVYLTLTMHGLGCIGHRHPQDSLAGNLLICRKGITMFTSKVVKLKTRLCDPGVASFYYISSYSPLSMTPPSSCSSAPRCPPSGFGQPVVWPWMVLSSPVLDNTSSASSTEDPGPDERRSPFLRACGQRFQRFQATWPGLPPGSSGLSLCASFEFGSLPPLALPPTLAKYLQLLLCSPTVGSGGAERRRNLGKV